MKYLISKKEKKETATHRYVVWLCALLLSLAMPFFAFSQEINSEKATSCDTIASSGFDPNKPAVNAGFTVRFMQGEGKLNVVSYAKQKQTVTLVPVEASAPDIAWLETELNRIYSPYGVTITVKTDDALKGNTEWDLDADGALNLNGSGFFSKETDEMKALRKLYQRTSPRYDRNAYYIFLTDHAKAGDKFKAATSNLMDYNNGGELTVWQWNVMANPAPLTWFDSEEDEFMKINDKYCWDGKKNGLNY